MPGDYPPTLRRGSLNVSAGSDAGPIGKIEMAAGREYTPRPRYRKASKADTSKILHRLSAKTGVPRAYWGATSRPRSKKSTRRAASCREAPDCSA